MYQSFEEAAAPAASGERIKALQRELRARKLKGFLVPHSDEHQDLTSHHAPWGDAMNPEQLRTSIA